VVQEVANELGPGYGRWAAKGDREFRLTLYSIMWKEGLGNGYQLVQETLVLSEPGDEYTRHAQVDFLDANWNVVFSTASDVKGTRLETPALLMAQPAEKKQLVRVWEVKVSPVGQSLSPELGLAMYGADGSVTTGGRYKALPGSSAVQDVANELGPGYGRWAAAGDREFRLTFYSVMWKACLVNGYQRVQDTLVLSESGDEFTEHGNWEFSDLNWTVVFSGASDVKGTRLETQTRTETRMSHRVPRIDFSAWARSASLRAFAFPTLAYLSSATRARCQSFCSPHISAAPRVISAGSKPVA
jgi:hypothetical protein